MRWARHRATLRYLLIRLSGRSRFATDAGSRTAGSTRLMIAWFGPVTDLTIQVIFTSGMPNDFAQHYVAGSMALRVIA